MKSKWVLLTLAGLAAAPVLGDGSNFFLETSISNMYVFPDSNNPVAGVVVATRDPNSITASISTSELMAGGAYSIWWVIFNRPQFCSDPCGLDDLLPINPSADPRVDASLLWGSGFVADADGAANVTVRLRRNHPPGEVRFGPGLKRVAHAEAHVVLRSHGSAIPGMVAEQTGSFGGGCGPAPTFAGCANVQFSVHFLAD